MSRSRTFALPVALYERGDGHACAGRDATGVEVAFDDLLTEGDVVATASDDEGNTWGPHGVVVRRDGALLIVPAEPGAARRERCLIVPAEPGAADRETM